jgi:hypothetical protein
LQSIPEQERNWLDGPWVVTEFYFYRRIVEAFRYFETGYDMFIKQKFTGLVDAMPYIGEIARSLPLLLETSSISNSLDLAIFTSLWGNKMDLSIWPSLKSQSNTNNNEDTSNNKKELTNSGEISSDTAAMLAIRSYILDDHTDKVTQLLLDIKQKKDSNGTPVEIGIVVDNAGYELVSDFILGHCLLALGVADVITFHTKAHPTFVSDATTQDCYGHISYLVDADNSNTAMIGKHFQRYVEAGKFVFDDDVFWCQPTAFWDMPPAIQEKLSQSKLVFVKGDANYRRLLGEREWPLATPADDILSYWPVPVCALRTFKAELGCGIDSISEKRAKEVDPSWMVSGKWGVVQLGGV